MDSLKKAKSYLGKEVNVVIDHPIGTKHATLGFTYSVNYGYIPNTKAKDESEIDAYYLGVEKPIQAEVGTVIAVIEHKDNDDHKLIVVPSKTEMEVSKIKEAIDFQENLAGEYTIIKG